MQPWFWLAKVLVRNKTPLKCNLGSARCSCGQASNTSTIFRFPQPPKEEEEREEKGKQMAYDTNPA
eukprot:6133643-Pyramimonas_sp.AAC.1